MSVPIFDFKKSHEPKGFGILRKILLLSALALLLLWGMSEKKLTLNLTPISFSTSSGDNASEKNERAIVVHPEVLNLQESFSNVAEAVKPAVVSITTVHIEKYQENPFEFFFWEHDDLFEQFFDMPNAPHRRKMPQKKMFERKIPGMGSGVIIDPDGFILTNEHVVRDANEIKVTLVEDPEKSYNGKVIGRDERTDLAVIKIKANKKLPFVKLGDSSQLKVGDWAIAIGSPFGLAQTVTVGVISAARQNLPIQNRVYKDLIQTDAAINPGNSGGPLLNIRGEVIGINTAIYTPSGGFAGIGFAIPIDRAKEILPQLREKGKVIRGWIGVILENKIDEATANVFGVPDKQGALIRDALPDYPAAKAGLKRGDIIREYNGKKVKDNYDLQTFVAATPPKETVPVKVIRNKKEITLNLTIAEAPESMESIGQREKKEMDSGEESKEETEWMGATVRNLTAGLKEHLSIPSSETGVVVTKIERGSKADEIGLVEGDLIRSVNQEAASSVGTFKEMIKKVNLTKGVVFDIVRKGESLYISYMGPAKNE